MTSQTLRLFLLTAIYQTTTQATNDIPCSTSLSSYPKNETDPDGNVYLMQITSVSCTCTTDARIVQCDYEIEGSSDKGSTKYDSISCNAVVCDERRTKMGFELVCREPENWKGDERFDVAEFNETLFEPWCVDPGTLYESGASCIGSYLFGAWIASMPCVFALF